MSHSLSTDVVEASRPAVLKRISFFVWPQDNVPVNLSLLLTLL